jgi:DNA (cytosine-5)-methyltransferase 1
VENSPMLISRGLDVVLADLSKMGFDAEWGIMGADNTGLPHRRKRIWLLATNTDCKHEKWMFQQKIPKIRGIPRINAYGMDKSEQGLRSILSPGLCRTCNGLPGQMDRLKAVGNAQVPRVAKFAFEILKTRMEKNV